jgi:hypothetical protein
MEREMNRQTKGIAAAALIASAFSTAAFAGLHTEMEVTVRPDPEFAFAAGSLGTARNTPDSVQWIGCSSGGNYASCTAVDAKGLMGSCSTSNPAHIAAIHSLNGDSQIVFAWDGTGKCLWVSVRNYSFTPPK